ATGPRCSPRSRPATAGRPQPVRHPAPVRQPVPDKLAELAAGAATRHRAAPAPWPGAEDAKRVSLILHNPRQQRWQRRRWVISLLIVLLPLLALYLYGQLRTPGAMLTSENYMVRPVFSYWVNDNWGGNGGVTCCWRIQGDTLKVVWILDVTQKQFDEGLDEERYELEVPNPPRQRPDDTLHVHFLPGNQVRLAWNHRAASPLEEELADYYYQRDIR